ncbi:hypothetical protein JAAARDRAFT_30168 [Jaapia argillacea MUCL 33604]|uniref:GDP/GTP exchange factor Sec2 N-terminal domain-containing protein n=1 Tax=Jaapia argillacea MUCL 33604 TaxID=933084 RepID=A0A067QFI1_9AGAM|nr:hypothetical protein JAAARDRAFT_30168 [Jaapia argillacea MUCL 33604]
MPHSQTQPTSQPTQNSTTFGPESSPFLTSIEGDVQDARHAISHGQEDDLRVALSRMLSRVEELAKLLKEAHAQTSDLQTELTLANSNLQLSLANNEMLEDALKRDNGGKGRDVGWRRPSAQERVERERELDKRTGREESGRVARRSESTGSTSQAGGVVLPPAPSSAPPQDYRFFRFRFGSSAAQATAHVPLKAEVSPRPRPSVVTSGSLTPHPDSALSPTLSTSQDFAMLQAQFLEVTQQLEEVSRHLEQLKKEIEVERMERTRACKEKQRLELELESLSQALFEEANEMVMAERTHRHKAEHDLQEAIAEKEALRSALAILEEELEDFASGADVEVWRRSTSSSAVGIKSRRSSRSSRSGSASSMAFVGGVRSVDHPKEEDSTSVSLPLPSHSPPALYLPVEDPPPSPPPNDTPPPDQFAQETPIPEESSEGCTDTSSLPPLPDSPDVTTLALSEEGLVVS